MTWAWIETSRAETASSQMISFGLRASARAMPMRWPGRRRTVRVALRVVGVEPDLLHQLPASARFGRPAARSPGRSSGAVRMRSTVCRGLSDEKGSWNTTWTLLRNRGELARPWRGDVPALEPQRARRRLHQPGHDAGRRWTCRCPTRPRRPGSRPARTSKRHASTRGELRLRPERAARGRTAWSASRARSSGRLMTPSRRRSAGRRPGASGCSRAVAR